VSFPCGEADPSGPALGVGEAAPLAPADGAGVDGADDATDADGAADGDGDPAVTGDGVGVSPHAATSATTSAATPIRAGSRVAVAARQRRRVIVTC
jgi:hypothetical protein